MRAATRQRLRLSSGTELSFITGGEASSPDVLLSPSFPAFGQAVAELLDRRSIGPRYIYLHDYGAPVGFHVAMQAPERVLGLIVQNANAHRTGLGPQWDATQAPYWSQPTPENEAAATA